MSQSSLSKNYFGESRLLNSQAMIDLKKNLDELKCFICLEQFEKHQKIGKLLCNHYFHKDCIYKWLKTNPTCPLCRENCKKFSSWL